MGHVGDKKRNNRNQDNLGTVPEYLRNFIESVGIRADEAEQARRPKQRQRKETENDSNTPVQKLAKSGVKVPLQFLFIA